MECPNGMSTMKKLVLLTGIVLMLLAVGAYYYFSGKVYVIRLTESQLKVKLEDKLPITKTYFFIIQVTLDNPRVHLVNGSNRVSAGMDVEFNIKLNKSLKPVGGKVDVSGGILYSPEKGKLYLTDPVIEKLQIRGIPEQYANKINKALTKALEKYYSEHPIYTLKSTDIKQAVAKAVLKSVKIENKELIITLGI